MRGDVSSQLHSKGESAEDRSRNEGMCIPIVTGDGMYCTKGTCTSIASGTGASTLKTDILHITPYHVATIAKAPGWESLFLWLLTPVEENHEKTSTLQREKERETTYQRVGPERRRSSEEDNVRRESEEKISQEIKVSKERRGNELPRESQREDGSGGCPPVVIVEEAPLKSNHGNTPEHLNSQTTTDTAESDTSNLDTATPYRKRTNAFTSDRVVSISGKPVVGRRGEAEKLTHSRQSQTHSSSWNQSLEEQSDEIWRTLGVVTETIGYMLWRSPDYNDIPPWKVCFESGCYFILIYFHFWFRYGGGSFHLWTILHLSMLSLSQPTL